MSAVTRWNPFKEMEELSNRLSSFWDAAPRGYTQGENQMTEADWMPAVDIAEDDTSYVIEADLPDLTKKDINVKIENGVLYISGERRREKEVTDGKRYHRTERSHGTFIRTFAVPTDADTNKVDAQFKDGVLRVQLLKREDAKPRKIEVKVN